MGSICLREGCSCGVAALEAAGKCLSAIRSSLWMCEKLCLCVVCGCV